MGFGGFVKKAFPFISAGAALGGPVGVMAASIVGKAVGVDKVEPTESGISDVIATALATPEQRQALLQAEHDFQIQMEQLGYKQATDLEQIAASDRDSARKREIAVRDKIPAVLAIAVTFGFFGILLLVSLHGVKQEARDLANIMIGTLGTAWVSVVTYYFGSSADSEHKSTLLASQNQK